MKQDFIRPVYSDDFVAVIANKSSDFRPNQLKKKTWRRRQGDGVGKRAIVRLKVPLKEIYICTQFMYDLF